jgi:zinc protease
VRPERLVVALVGDVDPDAAAALVARHLGGLAASGSAPEPPPEEPRGGGVRSAVERKDRAQAHLVIGFAGLRLGDPDRYALEVIAQVLGGQGGRLFVELRDRRSLAYSVAATHVEGLAPGFFAVYIATAPEKHDEARAGILDELRRLVDAPPAEPELERARHYLVGNHAIDEQRASNRALHVALDALYGLGPDASAHYAEQVRAVGRDDVLRVARRVFDLESFTLAAIRP